MTIDLKEIVAYLDALLCTSEIHDSANAMNGLQVENDGTVSKIALAVDGSLAAVQAAVDMGADLLIVHHGIFWSGLQPMTGAMKNKISLALKHNLAIYSSHLPLDAHPVVGNNVGLARILGMHHCVPAVEYRGAMIGCRGEFAGTLEELGVCLEAGLESPVRIYPYGPNDPNPVFVSSGDSASSLEALAALGAKTLVTGELSHSAITLAQDLAVNLVFGGHYATETLGVKALGECLREHWGLPHTFISLPTQA